MHMYFCGYKPGEYEVAQVGMIEWLNYKFPWLRRKGVFDHLVTILFP